MLVSINGDFFKGLTKTYITLGIICEKMGKKTEAINHFEKAEKIFLFYGNNHAAKEIQEKKNEILNNVVR